MLFFLSTLHCLRASFESNEQSNLSFFPFMIVSYYEEAYCNLYGELSPAIFTSIVCDFNPLVFIFLPPWPQMVLYSNCFCYFLLFFLMTSLRSIEILGSSFSKFKTPPYLANTVVIALKCVFFSSNDVEPSYERSLLNLVPFFGDTRNLDLSEPSPFLRKSLIIRVLLFPQVYISELPAFCVENLFEKN